MPPEQEAQQQATEQQTESAQQSQKGEQQAEAKTFDAEYVDKLRKENAKYRTEAKANSDAAKRLAEIEEAQKSEADKAAERLTAAEKRAAESESALWRAEVALEKGLKPSQARRLFGSTKEELAADADALLKEQGETKKQGNHVPREGHQSQSQADPMREFTRNLFGSSGD